jgi:hypothetical protein
MTMAGPDVSAREEDAYTLGVQAILWGYPMVCIARGAEAAVRVGASHVNALRRIPKLKTAADRDAVRPNNAIVDAYGWLDLRDGPVVVHVPALRERRWYIVQIGDMFDEVATNIGGMKGPRAGAFAVCPPRFDGKLPGELTKVGLRTKQASCTVQVFVDGEADLPAAAEVLNGFHLMPLSAYLREGLAYRPPDRALLPTLADEAPPALRLLDHIGQAMRWYLPTFADSGDPLVGSFHRIGLSVALGFDYGSLDDVTTRGLARAAGTAERIIDARWADVGETTNGWRYNTAGGHAGYDFALRAALAKRGVGVQLASEVLDSSCDADADGEPLHGRHDYELNFPPGELPPVSAFWNMSMFRQDMMFVENDAGRYSVGGTTEGLTGNRDGSVTLSIQHDRPDDQLAEANWLPAPDGPFNLTMRFYGPATTVLDGSYRLPAVAKHG